jgi:hypothetical protein
MERSRGERVVRRPPALRATHTLSSRRVARGEGGCGTCRFTSAQRRAMACVISSSSRLRASTRRSMRFQPALRTSRHSMSADRGGGDCSICRERDGSRLSPRRGDRARSPPLRCGCSCGPRRPLRCVPELASGVCCGSLPPTRWLRRTVSSRDIFGYMASWVRSPPSEPRRTIRSRSPEGVGPGRIPIANSPADAVDAARPPRWLADVVIALLLLPGSRLRVGDVGVGREARARWRCGPGFFASPILAPSFQLWLQLSRSIAASSFLHRASSSRRGPVDIA